MKILRCVVLATLLWSCDAFQYSPNEVRLEDHERDINTRNIQKLGLLQAPDTLKFILIGDSQRFYDETEKFVNTINQLEDVSFVLLAGDISDFGLNQEFKWINERLSRLKIPYITIIGNHDMLANGRTIYNKMFGPENFSFSVHGNTFICLNTNSEEAGFDGTLPDLNWLSGQLANAKTAKNVFVVSHVPPFSSAFDKDLEQDYAGLLSNHSNVRLSLHGHQHSFSQSYNYHDQVNYVVVGSLNKRNYALVTVVGTECSVEEKYF